MSFLIFCFVITNRFKIPIKKLYLFLCIHNQLGYSLYYGRIFFFDVVSHHIYGISNDSNMLRVQIKKSQRKRQTKNKVWLRIDVCCMGRVVKDLERSGPIVWSQNVLTTFGKIWRLKQQPRRLVLDNVPTAYSGPTQSWFWECDIWKWCKCSDSGS